MFKAGILTLFIVTSGVMMAQTPVELRIDHKAGQVEFDAGVSLITTLGEEVEVDRLE